MGSVYPGIPTDLVSRVLEALDLRYAVETGTYTGDSAAALAAQCAEVWTVEAAAGLFEIAGPVLAPLRNVHRLLGASQDVLPGVLSAVDGPALFWLDAHWSGGTTAGERYECPVLDEIRAINGWPHAAASCILIDDARLFFGPPPPPHDPAGWPGFMEVADALREVTDRYVTALDDVIIAVPGAGRHAVDEYWLQVVNRAPQAASRTGASSLLARTAQRARALLGAA